MTNVYFIGNLEQGYVKIGKSDNPEKRLQSLQTGNPAKLVLYKTIPNVADEYETYVQGLFEKDRVEGEWFKLTDELLKFMFETANNNEVKSKFKIKSSKYPTLLTVEENNNLFRECEAQNVPFLAMRKNKRGYYVEYDFITTRFKLNEMSTLVIKKVVRPFIDECARRAVKNKVEPGTLISTGCGQITGHFHLNDFDLCEKLLDQIQPVVMSKSNWEYRDELYF